MDKLAAKSRTWFLLLPFLLVIIALMLCLSIIYGGGVAYTNKLVVGCMVFAIFPSVAISLSGFFGKKILLFSSFAGLVFGVGSMFAEFSRDTGWQDLSGIMMFFIVLIFFIIAGAVLETIMYFINKYRKR